MTVLLSADSFTRANSGTLGPTDGAGLRDPITWNKGFAETSTGLEILSNAVGNAGPDNATAHGYHIAYLALQQSDVDLSVTTQTSVTATFAAGIIFRYVDDNNFWFAANLETTNIVIYKRASGTDSVAGNAAVSAPSGGTLRVLAVGSSITVYYNGTAQVSITDSFNVTATKHGIGMRNDPTSVLNTSKIDNWSASYAGSAGIGSLKIEAAYGQDPILTASPTWTDITSRVQSVTVNRGHQFRWDPFQPGTATLTFKDFDYGSDPSSNANLVPMTPVRISAVNSNAVTRRLFAGFISPDDGLAAAFAGPDGKLSFQCVDAMGWMARKQLPIVDPPVYEGERQYAIINDLVSTYGAVPAWAEGNGPDGGSTLFGPQSLGTDALSFVQMVALCEGGAFFIDRDGNYRADDRSLTGFGTRSLTLSQLIFDWTGNTGVSFDYQNGYELGYAQSYSAAQVSTVYDPNTVYSYSTTIGGYAWAQSFPPVTGALFTSASEGNALAQRLVNTTLPEYFPTKLTIKPVRDSDTLDAAIDLELRDCVTVIVPKSGGTVTAKVNVESISHSIDLQNNAWTTVYGFSSTDQLVASDDPSHWLILDDATFGKLDSTNKVGW